MPAKETILYCVKLSGSKKTRITWLATTLFTLNVCDCPRVVPAYNNSEKYPDPAGGNQVSIAEIK
jgi:hypothetical protein